MEKKINELSLFTGAGGGTLGTHLLNWRSVGYVEYNDYCQRILSQRISDGHISEAPIFSDINTFISEGYAKSYKGMVDVITAGFPCQPFSVAGQGKGEFDERNMWPQTAKCIRLVRPRHVLLENVPGLVNHGYFGRILSDLAEMGYDCKWDCIGARHVHAPHKRDRLWIVAHSTELHGNVREDNTRINGREVSPSESGNGSGSQAMADANGQRCTRKRINKSAGIKSTRRGESNRRSNDGGLDNTSTCQQWLSEPSVGRVANGVANRVDRLGTIGNGQVPAVVKLAWELLS